LEYIYRSLQDLEKKGEYVKVGLVGAGQMGSGLVSVAAQMPGFRIIAVADLEIERGIRAYQESGIDENQIVVTEDPVHAEKAIVRKKVVVTKEAKIISHIPSIEAVVEGTGLPTTGAEVALSCILSKKHVIMLNVETDVVVGLILKKLADNADGSGQCYRIGSRYTWNAWAKGRCSRPAKSLRTTKGGRDTFSLRCGRVLHWKSSTRSIRCHTNR
jgi:predicted homoserine dehydrogenase-like protein